MPQTRKPEPAAAREAEPAPADKARQERRSTGPRAVFAPLPRRGMFRDKREGEEE